MAYKVDDHPTHWLLVLYFGGNPSPADNGFALYGWDKSDTSEAGFSISAADVCKSVGLIVETHESFDGAGETNN